MSKIGYGYGSEWHLLRYLGRHRHVLDEAIGTACGGRVIDWLDFGFGSRESFFDAEWEGLGFVGDDLAVKQAWAQFWPQSGSAQNWDAVGLLQRGTSVDLLLLEAKAHAGELKTNCAATSNRSVATITQALDETKQAFGVSASAKWLTGHYQFCNRLAVLHFLMKHNVPARLVFVYFYANGNGMHRNEKCPVGAAGWQPVLAAMHKQVGLTGKSPLESRIHDVFLPIDGP